MSNNVLDGLTIGNDSYDFKDPNLTPTVDDLVEAMPHKAEIDGEYDSMTVGNAEQLVSTVGVEDKVPYNFRTAGGSADIGDRLAEKIVGGTVAWNQLTPDSNTQNTESGDIVSVDDAIAGNADKVVAHIEPVQSGSGDPSPTNICPISGFTGVEVQRTGKNLFGGLDLANKLKSLDSRVTIDTTNETVSYFPGWMSSETIIDGIFKPNTPYTFIINSAEGTNRINLGVEFTDGSVFADAFSDGENVVNSNGAKTIKRLYVRYISGDTILYYNEFGIFEGTITADAFEPYSGSTVSLSWQTESGTVYGGKVDLTTGVLTVDRASVNIGDTTIYLTGDSGTNYTSYRIADIGAAIKGAEGVAGKIKAISSAFKSLPWNVLWTPWSIAPNDMYGDGFRLITPYHQYESVTALKADLADVQIVYELATPQTYQLTAQQLALLLGTNNVWSSTGSTDLTYTASKKHHTLLSGRKYLTRISGTDAIVTGSGQKIASAVGTDNVFDLTQMLGVAIADYIATLEAGTAGAGTGWFRKLFPKLHYAYDAGSLQSVQVASHKTTGFNQFDKSTQIVDGKYIDDADGSEKSANGYKCTDYIRIVGGASYYISSEQTNGRFGAWYDASKNYISGFSGSSYFGAPITAPNNACYIRITIKTDISGNPDTFCINLHWDGERDGEYEPYNLHTYPLDSSLTLRGIPKLDSNNKLYYDGDAYQADGTVTRKYGIVDLGTLPWTKGTDSRLTVGYYFEGAKNGKKYSSFNQICAKYNTLQKDGLTAVINTYGAGIDKIMFVAGSNKFYIIDSSISDANALASSLDGVYAIYELATPTTEEADPFQSPQVVDDWGTEEYVDAGVTASTPTRDVAIPVGHDSVYQMALRQKLEMAPNSPEGDGDYIVRQSNGENEYVLLEKELPTAPTTAGDYTLKCTVSNGTATYSWVLNE